MTNFPTSRPIRGVIRRIALVAAAVVLSASGAQANFTLTTSISNVTFNGSSIVLTSLAAGSMFTVGGVMTQSTITVGSAGGYTYNDAAGSTFYILNDSRTGNTQVVSNEQIYLQNPGAVVNGTAVDKGVLNFQVDSLVTNNNATGVFTQSNIVVALNLDGSDRNYAVSTSLVSPPSQAIGGTVFYDTLPQAVSGNFNSNSNGSVASTISSVPEPASLAMLGLGLIGVASYSARRRPRRV